MSVLCHLCRAHSAYLCYVTYWKFNIAGLNVNTQQSNIFLNKLYNSSNFITNYTVVGIATRHGLQDSGLEFRCNHNLRTHSDRLQSLNSHLYNRLNIYTMKGIKEEGQSNSSHGRDGYTHYRLGRIYLALTGIKRRQRKWVI
jgi:hypothetical protein